VSHTIIFGDVETTGLEASSDLILEVGFMAVSVPEFEEIESWSTPIATDGCMQKLSTNQFVFDMHETSGLNAELRAMIKGEKTPVTPRAALIESLAFINRHLPNVELDERGRPELLMCGANPEFDRKFLQSWMPDLAKKFHYRAFDVNTLFYLRRWLLGGPREKLGTEHRTIADCRQSLAGVRDFVQAFGDATAAALVEAGLYQPTEKP
jgi:oligoribonuclease (3'-5' exoribonuclease)